MAPGEGAEDAGLFNEGYGGHGGVGRGRGGGVAD